MKTIFQPRELVDIPKTFEYKGLIFPEGFQISPSPYLVHRNPEVWPDPERFDPERFSKENSQGRHFCAFIPFSAGPRICIGKNFFYHEAKTILATVLSVVKFELDHTRVSGIISTRSGIVKPNQIYVKVLPRISQK